MICTTFPAYTVEAVNQLEDIGPLLESLRQLGIYREITNAKPGTKGEADVVWNDWEHKTGQQRPREVRGMR